MKEYKTIQVMSNVQMQIHQKPKADRWMAMSHSKEWRNS
jgi:hypothetical protein